MSKKTCFVIMPFGEKLDVNGKKLDFDRVYESLIKPAIEAAKLEVIRSDKIGKPGSIHAEMIEQIYHDDVAVVDITTLNANVFYELGVRHALRRSVTVLIRRKGTAVPFNIQGFNVIEYDPDTKRGVDDAKRLIGEFIHAGFKNRKSDSLVHNVLDLPIGAQSKPLSRTEILPYKVVSAPKRQIRIITGDIRNVKNIDIWVNSENTNMQMARFYDRSVSSVIRYLGAERDETGAVVTDTIADALSKKLGTSRTVDPATIIATTAGQLEGTNRVKVIFHAAAVTGAIGHGYSPIPNLPQCVKNALSMADSPRFRDANFTSILFPLFGTGTARGDARLTVGPLFEEAIAHLSTDTDCTIRQLYFLAWTEKDLMECQSVLDNLPTVTKLPAIVKTEAKRRPEPVPVASGPGNLTRPSSLPAGKAVRRVPR